MPKNISKRKTTKKLKHTPAVIKRPRSIVKVDAPSGEGKRMQARVVLKQRDVLAALRETRGHVGKACEIAGISRETYYNYLEQDPDFAGAVEAVKEDKVDDYIEALDSVALDQKYFPALKYFLDNHAQHRGFGREVKAAEQVAQKSSAPVHNTQINLSILPPETLKQLRDALAVSAGEDEKV